MNRFYLTVTISIACLLLLAESCKKKDTKYFEGVITYKITYSNNNDYPSYGSTMKVYYSKGNLLKAYNGTDPKGLRKELFLGATNQYYMQFMSSDTLFSYDISTNGNITLVGKKMVQHTTNILGYDCNKIELIQLGHAGNNVYAIYGGYDYSKNALRINRNDFKNWKFGNFNAFTNETGCYYLKLVVGNQDYSKKDLVTKTYEAVNIQEKPIDPKMFDVDEGKVKEFKMP